CTRAGDRNLVLQSTPEKGPQPEGEIAGKGPVARPSPGTAKKFAAGRVARSPHTTAPRPALSARLLGLDRPRASATNLPSHADAGPAAPLTAASSADGQAGLPLPS